MMKFLKEHDLALLLGLIAIGLCIVLGYSINFTWRQQDLIDTLNSQIEKQRQEITALTATNTVLNKEIDDLKELNIDMEKLNEYLEKQEESTELLQKILTP